MPQEPRTEQLQEKDFDAVTSQCQAAGFNLSALKIHSKRVSHYLQNGVNPTFPIIDTCRLDNRKILISTVSGDSNTASRYAAFVPAAGAASRYQTSLSELAKQQNTAAPMAPKALLPAVAEGDSFLRIKQLEHRAIGAFASQVFIAPAGESANFKRELDRHSQSSDAPFSVFEQDIKLSTLRFTESGRVLMESDQPSGVPAGHGSLLELLNQVPRPSGTHSFFIRNIDNICGVRSPAIQATREFLATHDRALSLLKGLRTHLQDNRHSEAAHESAELLNLYGIEATTALDHHKPVSQDAAKKAVFKTLTSLFGLLDTGASSWTDLIRLSQRPLVSMGMVPNLGKDIGGSPVIAETPLGMAHLCIELPHVAALDRTRWLSRPTVCSHFNPVFIAVEAPSSENPYATFSHPFWIVAEKTYRGRKVFYHESLMSEILGNSLISNCVFVEIPRILFTPHKTAQDALGRGIADWT